MEPACRRGEAGLGTVHQDYWKQDRYRGIWVEIPEHSQREPSDMIAYVYLAYRLSIDGISGTAKW